MGVKFSLSLEHSLRVIEERVLRGIFGLKREGVTGENCIMNTFARYYLGDQINEDEMGFVCSTQMENTHIIVVENLKERDHFGDLSMYWRIILKLILKKQYIVVRTGFI
jgi:hypothetical protein